MVRKLGVAVLMGWVFVAGMPHQTAWALFDDNSTNQAQGQGQAQAAVAIQGQAQGQSQSASQGNDQAIQVEGQRQNVVQSSPNLYLGQAEEGASVVTPWGNASAGKQAEMNKLAVAHSLVSFEEGKLAIERQALEAIQPCRWLGVGPKRFSLLFGWDCLTSLR